MKDEKMTRAEALAARGTEDLDRREKICPEVVAGLIAGRAAGLTWKVLAERYGVAISTASKYGRRKCEPST